MNPPHSRRIIQRLRRSLIAMLAVPFSSLAAQTSDGALEMEVITAYNFVVDSNVEAPSTKAPTAAHLGVRVRNTGSTPLTNVVVSIGKKTGVTSGPAVFESKTVPQALGYTYWTQGAETFSLAMPGGAADAVRVIPSLAPGQTKVEYFFVTYPRLDARGKAVTGKASDPKDDLSLNYDMWVTAVEGANPREVSKTTTVTMRNEIAAMANKVSPNTTAKVPSKYLDAFELSLGWRPTSGQPRIPGALVSEGIWYDFGTVGAGFDNNGDGIPDRNAWIQPVGEPALWDPLGIRFAKAYGVIVIKLNDGTERIIPFEDRLYFENIPANNTGAVGFVYYEYIPLTAGAQVSISPYQEVASGFDNEKFNGDYGAGITALAIPPPQISFVKSHTSPSVAPGETASFDITATNTGTADIGLPELGLPLVIEDEIPGYNLGVRLALAGATTLTIGRTVEISYYDGSTWSSTAPVDQTAANAITRVRWTLTDGPLAAAQSLATRLSLIIPGNYPNKSLSNTAIVKTGPTGQLASATDSVFVKGINSIGNLVWLDNNRNSSPDTGDVGLNGIKVSLYFDVNGDGILDSGDVLYEVKNTTNTGLTDNYLFTELPDGNYLAVVDHLDSDLPTGAILRQGSASAIKAIALDPTSINPSAVNNLDADWPFILPLEVNKRVNPTTYDEGDLVTYSIDLENWTQPVPALQKPVQTVYTYSGILAGATGQSETNALGSPDNSYARIDFAAKADSLEFNQPASATAWALPLDPTPITSAKLVIRGYLDQALTDDGLNVQFMTTTGATFSINAALTQLIPTATLNTAVGTPKNFEITLNSTSYATRAALESLRVRLIPNKVGANDLKRFWVDSVALVVTSNTTAPSTGTFGEHTFLNLPLVDTYNPAQLQFVSAIPLPDSILPAGTLTWNNLGTINPGVRRTVDVTFRALKPSSSPGTYTNTATSTGGTMVSGQTINSDSHAVNITVTRKGEIGDRIWWDLDADGVQDPGEPGLSNVLVTLNNGARTRTDENGFYLFSGLDDGTYTVTVHDRLTTGSADPVDDTTNTLPFTTGNFTQTFDPDGTPVDNKSTVTLNATTSSFLNRDFGYNSSQSLISGVIFTDNNGDGTQDSGENFIEGVTVQLLNSGGSVIATTTTNANGFYQFGALATGTYTVRVTQPAGTTQTLDPDVTVNNEHTVVIATAGAYIDKDFAYQPTGALILSGTVYRDWNSSSTKQTQETGISGIPVLLYEDTNGDGLIDAAVDALVATTTTAADGSYSFTNLAAGKYIVLLDKDDPDYPSSARQTEDYDGQPDGRGVVNLTASISNVNFGYVPFGTASIGDLVFIDGNNNGLSDPGEGGIPNISVSLYFDSDGDGLLDTNVDALLASTSTHASGLYSFTGLAPGQYLAVVNPSDPDLPANFFPTSPTTHVANLTSEGQTYLLADFGFAAGGSIGDFVFYDLNRNGMQDWNEPGIGGVTVRLFAADTNGNPTGSALATTTTSDGSGSDPTGFYRFTNLPAGTYAVVVDSTSGPLPTLTQTSDPDRDGVSTDVTTFDYDESTNPNGLPDADHTDSNILLATGATYNGADFGYVPANVFGDYVWFDLNRDGVQDPGERGIGFVELRLERLDGETVLETITVFTDPDGLWNAVLADGEWRITVAASNFATAGTDPVTPAGPLFGLATTYDVDGTGTANVATVTISGGAVTSPASTANLALDFGYAFSGTPYSISGTVIIGDAGTLGTADDNSEIPVPNQWVYLQDANGNLLATTQTDSSGNYSFSGLPGAATYYVTLSTVEPVLADSTLNTTAANNAAVSEVVDSGAAVRQTVALGSANVTDVDFAFTQPAMDFGDLPASYGITSLMSDGARHLPPDGGFTRYLGESVDTETLAAESPNADGDDTTGTDDEDGVTTNFNAWHSGSNGGRVTVDVVGGGWLVAWVDFNADGDFLDADDMVINQAVNAGSHVLEFDIPASANITEKASVYARFRLFAEQPAFSAFAYSGSAIDGEVEDYLFVRAANVSISGAVHLDVYKDGSDLEPIEGVLITLQRLEGEVWVDVDSDALTEGIQPTTTTTDADGYYAFTDLPPGTYRVLQTQPAGYISYREEKEGVDDGLVDNIITGIVLTEEDPSSLNNDFLELLLACPNLWAEWQAKWTLGDETPTGNSDGDLFSNWLEYVFCMDPNNGTSSPFCLVRSADGTKVDLVYARTTGGATDALYQLEYTATLSQTTTWSTSPLDISTAQTGIVEITYMSEGYELVRILDLQARTGLTSGGFVRLKVSGTGALSSVIDATGVAGWTDNSLSSTCRTCNTPYLTCPLFSGTISSVDGNLLSTSSGGGINLGTLLEGACYLEILSGTHEGQRFDISSGDVDALTVSGAGYSTLSALPQAEIAGSLFVVRPHQTIGSVFQPLSAFVAAENLPANASNVQIYTPGGNPLWTTYWLMARSLPESDIWVRTGDGTLADQEAAVIAPGQGFFIQRPASDTSTKEFLTFGHVRETAFVRPLATGANLVGGGYPVVQSPTGTDGRSLLPSAETFTATTDFKTADQILRWKGDLTANALGYETYYLTTLGGGRWLKTGEASLTSYNNTNLLGHDRAVFLRTARTIPSYKIPSPWQPGEPVRDEEPN